jgi:chemotaxis protein methyltransferase CheR
MSTLLVDTPGTNGFLKMDSESFERLSTYVTREYGIKLPLAKKTMLESRLNKKVQTLGLNCYKEFLDFIFSDDGKHTELHNVIDLITTNKTDFFREAAHFHFLVNEHLPQLKTEYKHNNLKVWSAGCSTGEEPYTLIMALEEFRKKCPETTYSILASDVSTRVIQTAFQGIYDIEKIAPVPLEMKREYFLRSKSNQRLVRVRPEFRKKIAVQKDKLHGQQLRTEQS